MHQRSQEVIKSCYELGIPPSSVKSEASVQMYQVDHLIDFGSKQIALEFDGPTHFVKDQFDFLSAEAKEARKIESFNEPESPEDVV